MATSRVVQRIGSQGLNNFPRTATVTIDPTGTNNALVYTSKASSIDANNVRVRYVVTGNSTALSVSVSTNDITVNVATDGGGAATSTAAQVKAAIEGSAPATALVTVTHATGNDGTGVVAAVGYTSLAGGTSYVGGTTSGRGFLG